MRAASQETREKNRGRGTGANYKPWIYAYEFNSSGTTANIIDWKHGRSIQCLSDGERYLYYILRWNDEVEDIREQFPLNLETTVAIAKAIKVRHPKDNHTSMTTDMLVTKHGGKLIAYSLKDSRSSVFPAFCRTEAERKKACRTAEKLAIEKVYWEMQEVQWNLIFKEDLNLNLADNIRRAVQYYDIETVHDPISMAKHLVATKQIAVNMEAGQLDFRALAEEYVKEVMPRGGNQILNR